MLANRFARKRLPALAWLTVLIGVATPLSAAISPRAMGVSSQVDQPQRIGIFTSGIDPEALGQFVDSLIDPRRLAIATAPLEAATENLSGYDQLWLVFVDPGPGVEIARLAPKCTDPQFSTPTIDALRAELGRAVLEQVLELRQRRIICGGEALGKALSGLPGRGDRKFLAVAADPVFDRNGVAIVDVRSTVSNAVLTLNDARIEAAGSSAYAVRVGPSPTQIRISRPKRTGVEEIRLVLKGTVSFSIAATRVPWPVDEQLVIAPAQSPDDEGGGFIGIVIVPGGVFLLLVCIGGPLLYRTGKRRQWASARSSEQRAEPTTPTPEKVGSSWQAESSSSPASSDTLTMRPSPDVGGPSPGRQAATPLPSALEVAPPDLGRRAATPPPSALEVAPREETRLDAHPRLVLDGPVGAPSANGAQPLVVAAPLVHIRVSDELTPAREQSDPLTRKRIDDRRIVSYGAVGPSAFAIVAYTEKKFGKGEDADPSLIYAPRNGRGMLSVYDGLGGSGSSPALVSGESVELSEAWAASRLVRRSVESWYLDGADPPNVSSLEGRVREYLTRVADTCLQSGGRSSLSGSMKRRLPTTLAAVTFGPKTSRGAIDIQAIWAGDSRCYLLTPKSGLQQLTLDHVKDPDVLRQLRDGGAPMRNAICAYQEFRIAVNPQPSVKLPAILLCATDGVFDYVRSPGETEYLLLRSLSMARDLEEWASGSVELITDISGDDATFVLFAIGWRSYKDLRRSFGKRYALLEREQQAPFTDLQEGDKEGFAEARTKAWTSYSQLYLERAPSPKITT